MLLYKACHNVVMLRLDFESKGYELVRREVHDKYRLWSYVDCKRVAYTIVIKEISLNDYEVILYRFGSIVSVSR